MTESNERKNWLKLPEGAKPKEIGELVHSRYKRSKDWLTTNYYGEWEEVWRNYKCVKMPKMRKNEAGKEVEDTNWINITHPDTFAHIRRAGARVTANLPDLSYISESGMDLTKISRHSMFQWDRGGTQSIQPIHIIQSLLFGWSLRSWYWADERRMGKKRINVFTDSQAQLDLIAQQYGVPMNLLLSPDPNQRIQVRSALAAKAGRGNMIEVDVSRNGYVGPKAEWVFIGDAFPEPGFWRVQESNWIIRSQRWRLEKIQKMGDRYEELREGLNNLLENKPEGDPPVVYGYYHDDTQKLYSRMLSVLNKISGQTSTQSDTGEREWDILAMHVPGDEAQICYCSADGNTVIGSIPYPFELEGKVALTECRVMDDLLCGIGDSPARIMRPLQELHDRQANFRYRLIYNLLRPFLLTSDNALFEQPQLLERDDGFRLLLVRALSDLQPLNEGASLSSAIASMNDEAAIQRALQLLTGDSNLSQAANVDPQQSKTATGAKILKATLDGLTQAQIASITQSSIKEDARIMLLMNRWEMEQAIRFDQTPYRRDYQQMQAPGQETPPADMVLVTPEDYQVDVENIVVKPGSTLADDDEVRKEQAQYLFQTAAQFPMLVNPKKAAKNLLISFGLGAELQAWEPEPPPPPPPDDPKFSGSVSFQMAELPEALQQAILEKLNINYQVQGTEPPAKPMPPGMAVGAPNGGPPSPGPPAPPMRPPQ